jgi:hypothetical protein
MGEVYRARDTRLDRAVAIKILPAHLAADPQLRERFDHEARAASALDHPHICPLYDLGEHEGTSFLVMQYLEGETLDARLSRGALPIDQALLYGMQIADALDKAHRAGIVHRDIKPGNVMLTKAGAKLLDFGLAKSTAPAGGVAGLSMLPTTPPGLTAQGTILGTFQYMAPEQLEGREADPRTDIFAFGAVLFEMITGRKAFEGRSQASLIGAILKDEPPPLSTLQPLTPGALDRLVKTCLAKDPDERWQSARDLHRELAWIAGSGLHISAVGAAGAPVRQRQPARLVAAVFAVAFVVSLAMLIWDRLGRSTDGDLTVVRFIVPTEANREATDYFSGGFALSPDGQTLAYVDGVTPTFKLLVRSVDSLESRTLATAESIYDPFWSPDGRFVAFFSREALSGNAVLRYVTVADGTTQTVCALPRRASRVVNGGTWGPDGTILFSFRGLFRCSPSGGEAGAIALGPRVVVRWPQFLPGQTRLLYYSATGPGSHENGVYLAAFDGGTLKNAVKVMSSEYPAQYVAPGNLVFVRDGVLLAQRFDANTGSLQGEPVSLAPKVAVFPDVNLRRADFSAAGGRVA